MKQKNIDNEYIRKRVERQKKIRRRRIKTFFAVFTVFLLIIAVVLSVTVLFPIKKINIQGSKIYSYAQIEKAASIEKNANLFTLSLKETENNIKTKLPFVDSISFKRIIPDTINITVKDAKEFASYNVNSKYYIVSKSGWVMEAREEKPENLIVISGEKIECKVGNEIKFNDIKQKELIDEILSISSNIDVPLNEINVVSLVDIKLRVDKRFEVSLGTSNYIEGKLKHLMGMIKNIPEKSEGKIDLSMWNLDNTQATFKKKANNK